MIKLHIKASALATLFLLSTGVAFADEKPSQDKSREKKNEQKDEQVYGSQLMTPQERMDHRAKMRVAKTSAEREKIRKEHHDKMKARAKERGVTIPDEPPVRGGGMGRGAY
jgi:hypothetical protein